MSKEFTIFTGSPDKSIKKVQVTLELGATEAVVRHTHSGICATDMEISEKGCSLGHEGVGIIEELGPYTHLLSDVKVGDRVGLGWMQKYCMKCRPCLTGMDSICERAKELWADNNTTGSFGTGGIWDVTALNKIPDEIESKYAGPLMCAGSTVWGAMQRGNIMSYHRVGVLGIGGLGHLALQFLGRSGCEVVAISQSDRKKKEAFEFGATEFITLPEIKDFKNRPFKQLSHLMVCTGVLPDFTILMPIMAMGGIILPLSVDFEPCPMPLGPTIFQGVNIIGVKVCNRAEYDDMLNFCVRHNVRPVIQEYKMDEEGLNNAFKALKAGKVHYRAVAVVG